MNSAAENSGLEPACGVVVDGRHLLTVRVYYEDTDFSGIVYHANYLRFLERGRTESLRAIGANQSVMLAAGGLFFAVRRMTIDWKLPALMDDVLTIETRTREMRGASMIIDQRILRDGVEILTAEVRVAAIVGGRPARIPDEIRTLLGGD
ncbi:tol-pal system-associated acyl-CoA thioesterase [Camelimonas fluminis]|uniref:Tol-pal system-associated acyl-CoA thioesterase n=1 Tax=Camelimonas fluminis TaxID=1576911 RepID=A0ABV7UJ91_9HYPH|nr:tol-pal system-associated acyl-CoA thioesterase [Camelimonas fluminis]GHE60022.1 tol-pal system-associated acyl-CoA thioesterase [Camelimonas fluminis]